MFVTLCHTSVKTLPRALVLFTLFGRESRGAITMIAHVSVARGHSLLFHSPTNTAKHMHGDARSFFIHFFQGISFLHKDMHTCTGLKP